MLDEIDPVDLSHVMWAMARFDSYPAPALVDEVLDTLPPQIASAEPAVSLPSRAGFLLCHLDNNRCACLYVPGQTHKAHSHTSTSGALVVSRLKSLSGAFVQAIH